MEATMWRRTSPHASNASIAFALMPDDKLCQQGGICLVKSLSIEDAFQWTQRLVAREWKLLLPVAFAFMAVPQLAFNLLMPAAIADSFAKGDPQLIMQLLEKAPWVMPSAIGVQVIALAGALSIAALALVPRISVREAIGLGLQRLFVLVVAMLLLFVAVVVLAFLVAALLQVLRLNSAGQKVILAGVIIGSTFVIWMRLITLAAVVAMSRAGPVASIRLAWELSAGAFWRILGCVLIYSIGAQVVVLASTFALGAIFVLTCSAIGAPSLGPVLSITYATLASAAFWAGFHVLAAGFYRQLGGSIRGA
ncbi:MAG: hypothetical protein JF628_02765 [Sphingomonas sp.]|nr:hypothetical protein [Sphingomonas sp.]